MIGGQGVSNLMYGRWFSATVVILWLATMSWLVKEKVLPLMLVGEPPSLNRVIQAQREKPVVGWQVVLHGRPVGWALADTQTLSSGLTEVRGRVHFDSLRIDEMMPGWLQPISRLMGSSTDGLQFDARNVLTVDALGHQVRFDSALRFDPWDEVITVHGTIEGGQAELQVRLSDEDSEPVLVTLPLSDALLSDAFSPQPQTELPGLRAGQTWSVPVYSPLWPDKNKSEILIAKVVGRESIVWNNEGVSTWLVVFRTESAGGVRTGTPRAKLWVRPDGAVLQQEALLFGSTVLFVRLSDTEAEELATTAGRRWWSLENDAPRYD